jgi:hypothetical protein
MPALPSSQKGAMFHVLPYGETHGEQERAGCAKEALPRAEGESGWLQTSRKA